MLFSDAYKSSQNKLGLEEDLKVSKHPKIVAQPVRVHPKAR